MKTKLEIIEETAAFYSEDTSRRALHPNILLREELVCAYLTDNAKMCAVGRCCENPGDIPNGNIDDEYVASSVKFKTEYQGHGFDFWRELQVFHDKSIHWNETGLSKQGQDFLQKLKTFYAGQ